MGGLPSLMPRLRPGSAQTGRIDRQDWRAGTCFGAYGLRVGVRTNAPALLDRLGPHLPPGWRALASPVVDRIFSVWVDTADLDHALAALESEIRLGIAAGAVRRTFVHAGVAGWRGRAIVLPGRSRSGKTTLVAELVRAGTQYLSDEFAVLDRRGRVHPFAKPLSIRGAGGCDVHVQARRAEDLGGSCGERPLPVRLVAFAEHRPGAIWRPERLTAGRAVLEMLGHTVPARLRPEESLVSLERAVTRATVLKGVRGEAREMAEALLRAIEDAEAASRRGTGEEGTR